MKKTDETGPNDVREVRLSLPPPYRFPIWLDRERDQRVEAAERFRTLMEGGFGAAFPNATIHVSTCRPGEPQSVGYHLTGVPEASALAAQKPLEAIGATIVRSILQLLQLEMPPLRRMEDLDGMEEEAMAADRDVGAPCPRHWTLDALEERTSRE